MAFMDSIVGEIRRDVAAQFEERLRQQLVHQDKEWLVEQLVHLTLRAHNLEVRERTPSREASAQMRAERLARVRTLALDEAKVRAFLAEHEGYDDVRLVSEGCLVGSVPLRGGALIPATCRSEQGERLLTIAKDMLFAVLFGDETTNTHCKRVQRELLTIALPRFKAHALGFMQASTELSAQGTWQDPERVSNDSRADNVILEVEFGETEGELMGQCIVRALSLINHLEVNEQILYARMENIEQSTLIE